jgi:hypothetical protein
MRLPEVLAEYVRTYHEERKRLAVDADRKRNRLERKLGDLNRALAQSWCRWWTGHRDGV